MQPLFRANPNFPQPDQLPRNSSESLFVSELERLPRIPYYYYSNDRQCELSTIRGRKVTFEDDANVPSNNGWGSCRFERRDTSYFLPGALRKLIHPMVESWPINTLGSYYFTLLSFLPKEHLERHIQEVEIIPMHSSDGVLEAPGPIMTEIIKEAVHPEVFFKRLLECRPQFIKTYGKQTLMEIERVLGIDSAGLMAGELTAFMGMNFEMMQAASFYLDYEGTPLLYQTDYSPDARIKYLATTLKEFFELTPGVKPSSFHTQAYPWPNERGEMKPKIKVRWHTGQGRDIEKTWACIEICMNRAARTELVLGSPDGLSFALEDRQELIQAILTSVPFLKLKSSGEFQVAKD